MSDKFAAEARKNNALAVFVAVSQDQHTTRLIRQTLEHLHQRHRMMTSEPSNPHHLMAISRDC